MKHLILIAVILVGLALRLGGLAHGLSLGEIYHPDTPKQVRIIGEYLGGARYVHIGKSDYDGYPLFVSYLTSRVVRHAVMPVMSLLGLPGDRGKPDLITLFQIMRLINVALATLAIFIAWRIGRENFGEGIGLVAAGLLAFSPADIAACHYATGDTGAASFGLVAVYFALRIYRTGRWPDYLLSGFFGALAFASKYHALVVFAAPGLAHILRRENFGRWHGRDSIARLAALGAAILAGLWIAIPGLREAPLAMITDIRNFMNYAANFGLTPELRQAGFLGKMAFSLQRNLPILLGLLTAPVVAAALISLAGIRRDPRIVILLAAPLVYFFAGVSLRPFAHPVYHTILTAPVFLLAAVAFARPFACDFPSKRGRILAAVSLAAVAASYVLLAHTAGREFYFFRRDDTRRFAKQWSEENMSPRFKLGTPRYTFESDYFARGAARPDGLFYFSPSIRPEPGRDDCVRWFSFGVERDALPFFRNPVMEAWLHPWSAIHPDARMPVFQRIPSRISADFLFTSLPEFFRSGRIFDIAARHAVARDIVSETPLRDIMICIASEAEASRIEIEIGRREHIVKLPAWSQTNLIIRAPLERLPLNTGFHHYAFRATAHHGGVRLTLAFTDQQKGVDLFQQGSRTEALPYLKTAALTEKNPTLAAMAIAAGADPRDTTFAILATACAKADEKDGLLDTWGVAEKFMNAIPYLRYDGRHLLHTGFTEETSPDALDQHDTELTIHPDATNIEATATGLWLDPGAYTITLHAKTAATNETVAGFTFLLNTGRRTLTNTVNGIRLPPDGTLTAINASVLLPDMSRSGTLTIRPTRAPLTLDDIEIHPDPLATLRHLHAQAQTPRPAAPR